MAEIGPAFAGKTKEVDAALNHLNVSEHKRSLSA